MSDNSFPPVPLDLVLVLVNEYVESTAKFLNQFVCQCEEKISNLACRIDRLELEVCVLEGKFQGEEEETIVEQEEEEVSLNTTPPPTNNNNYQDDDAIAQRYLSMVRVGIPKPAILLKMQASGHDKQYEHILN